MTDKQIIIDDVDVSGCEFYNKDDKTCREINGNYDTDICEFDKCENSNCCYKQLKHKEQEVQQAMDNYVQLDLQRVKEYNKLVDLYKAKEQECEELKIYIESNEQQVKEVEAIVMDNDRLINEAEKLKQTLTEIKEIANKVLLNTHDLEQFKDADALFGALLEIHKKSAR